MLTVILKVITKKITQNNTAKETRELNWYIGTYPSSTKKALVEEQWNKTNITHTENKEKITDMNPTLSANTLDASGLNSD